jgi:16S rRNA (uracil1498-N3)-methyltransferase
MHRFFVPPAILKQQPAILPDAHQLRHVLRLQPGDAVVLCDNSGLVYEATIAGFQGQAAKLLIVSSRPGNSEPPVHVTLYQAVLKGDHFNWVLQKGTEAGVSRFVPIVCERSVVADHAAIRHKCLRWERIIQEAAEQSGRCRLPELAECLSFGEAVRLAVPGDEHAAGLLRLIPWEGEHSTGLRAILANCNLGPGSRIQVFVGPEGGLTEAEVRQAQSHGIRPVSLGPRILRAETAGLVTTAAIMYETGAMAPA